MDLFAESYAPASALEPEFQDFLGKLVKKIGKGVRSIAKTAVKGIATLGLGPILNRIKALVRPLLNKVLQKAIGRLPESLQPAARNLAAASGARPEAGAGGARDGRGRPNPRAPATAPEPPPAAAPEPRRAGCGFARPAGRRRRGHGHAARVRWADCRGDAVGRRSGVRVGGGQGEGRVERPAAPVLHRSRSGARASDARARDTSRKGRTRRPYVENFLPAVLPALRIATRLIGRPRVVGFLAGFLGKLISNLVGPQHAPALVARDGRCRPEAREPGSDRSGERAARDVRGRRDGRGDVDPRRLASGSRPRQPGAARRVSRSRRSSRRRPPTCRRSSRRRPTRSGRSCSKGESTRPGSCSRCAGRDTSAARERSTSRSRRRWRRRSRASRTRRCRITSRTSWACRRGKTSKRRFICSRCSPAARRPTSRATKAETPGLGAADEVTLSQLQPLTHEAAGVLLGTAGSRPQAQSVSRASEPSHPGSVSSTWSSDDDR